MDKITPLSSETSHALSERLPPEPGDTAPRGRTWCGRNVTGRTGACIAPLIGCGSCRRSMRKHGYAV
jgi:hypothetical protein